MVNKRADPRLTRLASDGRFVIESRDDRLVASTVGLASENLESIAATPCLLLRPAAYCSSWHPNSASSASNVGKIDGVSTCFICTVAPPYRLRGQLWRADWRYRGSTENPARKMPSFITSVIFKAQSAVTRSGVVGHWPCQMTWPPTENPWTFGNDRGRPYCIVLWFLLARNEPDWDLGNEG